MRQLCLKVANREGGLLSAAEVVRLEPRQGNNRIKRYKQTHSITITALTRVERRSGEMQLLDAVQPRRRRGVPAAGGFVRQLSRSPLIIPAHDTPPGADGSPRGPINRKTLSGRVYAQMGLLVLWCVLRGAGSASRISMGTVVFSGLPVSTVLSLFIPPSVYLLMKQRRA